MKRTAMLIGALASLAGISAPRTAEACGALFYEQQPVDQQAERIVFAMQDDRVRMVVQIRYQGDAEDFAWLLPVPAVPDSGSLDVFPQLALQWLDATTAPRFLRPAGCYGFSDGSDGGSASADGSETSRFGSSVDMHVRKTVGPYDVAVIDAENPDAIVEWLRGNDYRVTARMEPYVRDYIDAGMKLLALKLRPDRDTSDIQPFDLTLPGETPSIPLKMTALAAEPEMGVLVFTLGNHRYGPKNWPELDISDDELLWKAETSRFRTNWAALVAEKVDAHGGRGFETELASPTRWLVEEAGSLPTRTDEQQEAKEALVDLLGFHSFITRMYSRLSSAEMSSDPIFGRVEADYVERTHQLPRYDRSGHNLCEDLRNGYIDRDSPSPCDFTTCGASGLCREAYTVRRGKEAACACAPGTTARTTLAPDGSATVICEDKRMSFLNPGEREDGDTPLPDPCVTFECGPQGRCVSMNMTPTCECNRGYVARGWRDESGKLRTRCVEPNQPVPESFYETTRPPALSASRPPGRAVEPPPPPIEPGGGGCSVGVEAGGPLSGPASAALAMLFLAARRRRGGGQR